VRVGATGLGGFFWRGRVAGVVCIRLSPSIIM
jgi:hypothetical protein